jgi:hypothetical protein
MGITYETCQSDQVMPMIVSIPCGFHLITGLPKGSKSNARYYITQIVGPFSDWRHTQVGKTNRKLIAHGDTARPHTERLDLDCKSTNVVGNIQTNPKDHMWFVSKFTGDNHCGTTRIVEFIQRFWRRLQMSGCVQCASWHDTHACPKALFIAILLVHSVSQFGIVAGSPIVCQTIRKQCGSLCQWNCSVYLSKREG